MKYKFGKTIVIALGGSIMYPEHIDSRFIRDFKSFIERQVKQGRKFVLVVGGGKVARFYQTAAEEVGSIDNEDKDWLGIHATRMNAHLIRTVFKRIANPVVIDARGKVKKLNYAITVSSGWRPGWSTDFVAAALAEDFRVPEVVVVGKPDHVYDQDPGRHPEARPFEAMSWREYRKLIPAKWIPGFHAPVDPIAAKLGEKKGIKAIVVAGKDLKNLEALLKGREFKGTIIA